MTDLRDRAVRILVYRARASNEESSYFSQVGDAFEITQMAVRFKVEKSLAKEPNKAEVTIVNLGDDARSELLKLPLRVHVEAGYVDTGPRLLFVGDVLKGSASKRTETGWETTLRLGDGQRAFAGARVNRSYAPATPMRTILRDAARSMGLDLPPEIASDRALDAAPGAVLLDGYASDELGRLLASYGYTWSMQNGKLQILRDEQPNNEFEIPINQGDGMIGSPELEVPKPVKGKSKKKRGTKLKVSTLLYPEIYPGRRIRVTSIEIDNALFKVDKVTHDGDTHGQNWQTDVEATPL